MTIKSQEPVSVVSGPDRFAIQGDHFTGYITDPARSESSTPFTFRFARYPDGRRVLQGCFQWVEGLEGGVTWRDLPCVDVDEDGQELA